MKFLGIGFFDPEKMARHPSPEIQAALEECSPHLQELYATGHVLIDIGVDSEGMALSPTGSGSIVIASDALGSLVGGVFVLEASTLDEAAKLAALHPSTRVSRAADFGWRLEIRPVHTFELPNGRMGEI